MVTSKFEEYAKALAEANLEFNHLKAAILGQSIMEMGRGDTKLFQDHNNPRGVHYHDFLAKWAHPVKYETDTEPNGWGIFCHFATLKDAVDSYFAWFDYWQHYGDWRQYARKTATDFLAHIGPHYCPPGYTPEWAKKHSGLNYHQYIMQKYYAEAEQLLAKYKQPEPSNEFKVTWFEFNRDADAKPVLVGYDGDKPKFVMRNNNVDVLIKTMQKFPDAKSFLVAPAGKAVPGIEEPKPEPKPSKAKLIYIEPGHSKSAQGAQSLGDVNEYEMNELAAKIMIDDIEKEGHKTKTYNPDPDNLTAVGQAAKGCDAAFSLHHNAFDKKEHYARCYLSRSPNTASIALADKISQAISDELKLGEVNNEKSGFTVPNIFAEVCKGPSMLIEFYFIDAWKDRATIVDRTTRAAHAAAREIIKWANS